MVLYLSIIGFTWILLSITNCLWANYGIGNIEIVGLIFLGIFISFCIDGACALGARLINKKIINPFKGFFAERKNERKFYEKLKIRVWKDKIPELGKMFKCFDKSKVENKNSSQYLLGFITETCYAEIIHLLPIFFAFLLLIIFPSKYFWGISFPIVVVNVFLQIPPICVQRYNRPKLIVAYNRAKKFEEKQNNSISNINESNTKLNTEDKKQEN